MRLPRREAKTVCTEFLSLLEIYSKPPNEYPFQKKSKGYK